MSNAVNSVGTTLKHGANVIAELKEINGIDISGETIDVTTLSSTNGYREFVLGFKDPGEISISGFFYPGDTTGQYQMYQDMINGDSASYTIDFPTDLGASWTFDGYVMNFKTGAVVEDAVTFEATIKVSGEPTLGTTASTGWSAFVLRTAADAGDVTNWDISPAVAAGTYRYTASFDTDTTVYPKVTAASHTIKLYVDDAFVEELTTATIGSGITFAVGVKKLTVKVWESGKTPVYYDIMVERTA